MARLTAVLFIAMTFKGQTMTQSQALTNALILALIAPSDEKASQASELAESIAKGLDFDQVEQCKADALLMLETI